MGKIFLTNLRLLKIISFFVCIACALEEEAGYFDHTALRAQDLIKISENIKYEIDYSLEEIGNISFTYKSPDDKKVANVERMRTGIESQIYMISISETDKKHEIKIHEVVNFYGLCWSPEGSKIAFSEGTMVHIADSDGKTKQTIYTGPGGPYPGASFNLRWSENGRQLSFIQVENAQDFELANPALVTITLGKR